MKEHKNDLGSLSTRQLLARRRAAAARLGDVEQVLAGALTEQTRRCGRAGCRCERGEPHGPYLYFSPSSGHKYDACFGCLPTLAAWVTGPPGSRWSETLAPISYGPGK